MALQTLSFRRGCVHVNPSEVGKTLNVIGEVPATGKISSHCPLSLPRPLSWPAAAGGDFVEEGLLSLRVTHPPPWATEGARWAGAGRDVCAEGRGLSTQPRASAVQRRWSRAQVQRSAHFQSKAHSAGSSCGLESCSLEVTFRSCCLAWLSLPGRLQRGLRVRSHPRKVSVPLFVSQPHASWAALSGLPWLS